MITYAWNKHFTNLVPISLYIIRMTELKFNAFINNSKNFKFIFKARVNLKKR